MVDLSIPTDRKYHAMVIGVSAGAYNIFEQLLPLLPVICPIPLIIVMHIGKQSLKESIEHFNAISQIPVVETHGDMAIQGGYVYFAPSDYHLQVESDYTFSLSTDEKVNYSRPSIDILFETASRVYNKNLIGLILTGANKDGTEGMKEIANWGGLLLVQEPSEAYSPEMPLSVIQNLTNIQILSLEQLKMLFKSISIYCEEKVIVKKGGNPCLKY